ncbi:MAG TPA: hypothetical protein VEL28_00345 [Candidatus Binatia bacterium]|nr:hypothetical protein [Candidatus Binatia bacterium]
MNRSYPLLTATMFTIALAAGCASKSRTAADEAPPPPAREVREAAPERAPAAKAPAAKKGATTAPAGSALSKITRGMPHTEVERILGQPDSQRNYETGKRWIPGYGAAGQDNFRTEYIYRGVGRVTFSRNDYTGSLKVLRVDADPNI